jgi:hypothetical protein
MRGPAFFAYADNYLIDVKFGIIMDVKATRAIRHAEVGAAKTMIERTEERFDIKPRACDDRRPKSAKARNRGGGWYGGGAAGAMGIWPRAQARG